ncbi:MAG: hypothetical protein IID33_04485 [Planctomycetes bacterium]|nr:hypothetical protein [Planctomycetota bacterium]
MDDVDTIGGHFRGIIAVARTNNINIGYDNLVVGVLYGAPGDLSAHYHRITRDYNHPVYVGQEFWQRLTGDEIFYDQLIDALASVAVDADFSKELENVITELSKSDTIQNI